MRRQGWSSRRATRLQLDPNRLAPNPQLRLDSRGVEPNGLKNRSASVLTIGLRRLTPAVLALATLALPSLAQDPAPAIEAPAAATAPSDSTNTASPPAINHENNNTIVQSEPAAEPGKTPAEPVGAAVSDPVGTAEVKPNSDEKPKAKLPDEIQVVRFTVPEGVKLEILSPNPEPVPQGDGQGAATVGLHVGYAYRLRLSNLPERPGAELYPIVEVIGHLHRPDNIDPGKFPIRVVFGPDDIEDALDHARFVTQVVYLEQPEQATTLNPPKFEIPRETVTSAENPLRIASAYGRVMAIVQLGSRTPSIDDLEHEKGGSIVTFADSPCPYLKPGAKRACGLPCGPIGAKIQIPDRPIVARDEYLCDGGDYHHPSASRIDGTTLGVEPRDTIVSFQDARGSHTLPTNIVCIYAPRFAAVRNSVGAIENLAITVPVGHETLARQDVVKDLIPSKKMTQNQSVQQNRLRSRSSALVGKQGTSFHVRVRMLQGYDSITHLGENTQTQKIDLVRTRDNLALNRTTAKLIAIKTAESAVLTGMIEGARATVMSWIPESVTGEELPPKRPGLGVYKQVSTDQAEPGDVVSYRIRYRNLGNTPITAVSIVDSLLPRLEYVDKSAQGPAGTIFTARENKGGSSELRWDLPNPLKPGDEGYVSFQARVR
jgi:uncharacterized repeat protein (TIGR01451 family)